MSNPISPEAMWQARFEELELDFEWAGLLLGEELDPQQPGLGGSLNQTLSEVQAAFNLLKLPQPNVSAADRWAQLAAVRRQSRRAFADILELLGGLALRSGLRPGEPGLDNGISARAEGWLRRLLPPLGLTTVPTVVPARGPLVNLDPADEPGLVRAPFLDWDLWHLPLLGRAVGLIAAAEDPKNRLRVAAPAVQDLIPVVLAANPDHAWRYLQLLFADMFTTAVLGPVYALPVFLLDLDYAQPSAYGLENPDLLSGSEAAPRLMPSPVERAAAILETLAYIDNKTGGQLAEAAARLEALWTGITTPLQQEQLLAQTQAARLAGHQRLLNQVLAPLLSIHWTNVASGNPGAAWQKSLSWYAFLSSPNKPHPEMPPEIAEQDFLTAVLGALWWHRLHHPDRAKQAAENTAKILKGDLDVTPYGVKDNLPAAQLAAAARREALQAQARRLERVLLGSALRPEDRELVSGRLFQMLSHQVYQLDQIHTSPPGQLPGPAFWQQAADAQQAGLPLKREALEFLGGLLLRYRGLTSRLHPPDENPPPSICSLAEHQLERLVVRTGVNWKTLIIPGPDAFVATDTEIIRVRFPDWSVWNLPLMAHEFGHVVARTNAVFRNYQWNTALQATAGVPEKQRKTAFDQVQSHLEEIFCDIFATFVLGPAFACNALLLQFNPPEAAAASPSHPTHDERALAILTAMEAINARAPEPIYQQAIDLLRKAWQDAVQQSLPVIPDQAGHDQRLNQAEDRARELFAVIDRQFRLGAGFTEDEWQAAQALGARIAKYPPPTYQELSVLAQQQYRKGLTLAVLLNALWWARLRHTQGESEAAKLARLANDFGRSFLLHANGGAR